MKYTAGSETRAHFFLFLVLCILPSSRATFNNVCSLHINTTNDCISCTVELSGQEAFFKDFGNRLVNGDQCQVHINSRFRELVRDCQSGETLLIVSLETNFSVIDSTKRILFKIDYEDLSGKTAKEYHAVNVELLGSHRDLLNRTRIPLPLGDVNLQKSIEVTSHSEMACDGLWNSFKVNPLESNVTCVKFERKESSGCLYNDMVEVKEPYEQAIDREHLGKRSDGLRLLVGILIAVAVVAVVAVFFIPLLCYFHSDKLKRKLLNVKYKFGLCFKNAGEVHNEQEDNHENSEEESEDDPEDSVLSGESLHDEPVIDNDNQQRPHPSHNGDLNSDV